MSDKKEKYESPEVKASFFNRLFMHWMSSFMWQGYKKPLKHENLYDLRDEVSSGYLTEAFEKLWTAHKLETPNAPVSLFKVLQKQFGPAYYVIGILHFIQAGANIAGTSMIGQLTNFVLTSQSSSAPPFYMGFVYAAILIVLQLIATLSLHRYFYFSMQAGLKVRAVLTSVCYRKLLTLDSLSRQRFSGGRVLNMVSSDLARLDGFLQQGHYMWSGPLQIITIMAYLIALIGPSSLAGFAVLFIMLPIQGKVMMKIGALRKANASITDSRIRLTQEFLSGIKIIKLFAWEELFLERLLSLRTSEIRKTRILNIMQALMMGIATSVPIMASVISFIVYAVTGGNLNPAIIFQALALFNMMRFPMIILPMILRGYAETKVSLQRVSDYLNTSELSTLEIDKDQTANSTDTTNEFVIEINDGEFCWEELPEEERKKLSNEITKKNSPSRNSSPHKSGENHSNNPQKADETLGPSQEAPHEKRSQLRNINLKVKKGKLVAIIGQVGSGKSTLLNSLLQETKKISGKVTIRGTMGYSLQQPWIQNATLIDNITFGLPLNEEKFARVIKVSALEPDLEWLPGGRETLLGEKEVSGGQKARVSLARIAYCSPDIVLLDDPLSAVDVHVGRHIFYKCIKEEMKHKTVLLVTHHLTYLKDVDYIVFMKDGTIAEQGTYEDIMKSEKEASTLIKQFSSSDEKQDSNPNLAADPTVKKTNRPANMMQEEERAEGSISSQVYSSYISSAGGVPVILVILVFIILGQVARVGTDVWLAGWSVNYFPQLNPNSYAGIYFAWGISQGIFTALVGSVVSYVFALASEEYHKNAIIGVFKAPMSFFDGTPLGRIVNRFGKDTDIMDSELPSSMQMFVSVFAGLISTLALMIYSSPWLLIPLFPLIGVYIFLQKIYLRTSRELKRLEAISRSPVVSHFTESMTGLSTIRAYNRNEQFLNNCEKFIDNNNRCTYLQIMTQRWLGIRLEIIGSLLCLFVSLFGIIARFYISPSIFALALSYSLQITTSLNFVVRQAVEVEVNANSIERLHHYSNHLDAEAPPITDPRPPKEWPEKGVVQFNNLEVRYSAKSDPVLTDLSFSIGEKEKIGIVGRTGAGKSTITYSMFRLIEPSKGSITIDGIVSSSLGLRDLRSRLAIIPQDPILFSGTVRSNLDPSNQNSDDLIWNVLQEVNMKETVSAIEDKLDGKVDMNGENFSTGQRQLFCLARAMLKQPRILIMDEATANVDMDSDRLIQESLRRDFKESTLITIAHRINTIIDYDKVLVLDKGKMIEYDTPNNLLEKSDGYFSKMVDGTGPTNSALLRKIAKDKALGLKLSIDDFATANIVVQ